MALQKALEHGLRLFACDRPADVGGKRHRFFVVGQALLRGRGESAGLFVAAVHLGVHGRGELHLRGVAVAALIGLEKILRDGVGELALGEKLRHAGRPGDLVLGVPVHHGQAVAHGADGFLLDVARQERLLGDFGLRVDLEPFFGDLHDEVGIAGRDGGLPGHFGQLRRRGLPEGVVKGVRREFVFVAVHSDAAGDEVEELSVRLRHRGMARGHAFRRDAHARMSRKGRREKKGAHAGEKRCAERSEGTHVVMSVECGMSRHCSENVSVETGEAGRKMCQNATS